MNIEDDRSLICVIWRLVVHAVRVAHTGSFQCWHAVILTNQAAWPARLARCRTEMNRSQCAEFMILFCTLELPFSSKQKQPIIIDNLGMCRFTKQSRSLHGWSMWFRCRSLVSHGLFLFFLFLYSPPLFARARDACGWQYKNPGSLKAAPTGWRLDNLRFNGSLVIQCRHPCSIGWNLLPRPRREKNQLKFK